MLSPVGVNNSFSNQSKYLHARTQLALASLSLCSPEIRKKSRPFCRLRSLRTGSQRGRKTKIRRASRSVVTPRLREQLPPHQTALGYLTLNPTGSLFAGYRLREVSTLSQTNACSCTVVFWQKMHIFGYVLLELGSSRRGLCSSLSLLNSGNDWCISLSEYEKPHKLKILFLWPS